MKYAHRHRILGCLSAALLVSISPVPGRAAEEVQTSNTLTSTSPAPSLSHGDKHFITKAAMASTNEVALSQLAIDRATNPEVKAFAQQMITDHQQANNDLQALAAQKNVDITKSITKGQTDDVESLGKKSGDDFDKAYMKKMVKAHDSAVSLFKKESTKGKDADTIALATKYLATLTGHYEHAKSIEESLKK